jgi:hypothetical protein
MLQARHQRAGGRQRGRDLDVGPARRLDGGPTRPPLTARRSSAAADQPPGPSRSGSSSARIMTVRTAGD